MKRVGIIGMGRVGSALAYGLQGDEYRVVVVSRRTSPGGAVVVRDREFKAVTLAEVVREAQVLFIATPDGFIADLAARLVKAAQVADDAGVTGGEMKAARLLAGKGIFHFSGAHSAEILAPLRGHGAMVGSLHPLQSFADVEQAIGNLPGSYFTYQGDQALLGEATKIVKKLGGILKSLPGAESKVIYHAGACFVSNFLVALVSLGASCLERAGFSEEEARLALVPLMRGTVNNLSALPLTEALTGPIMRGDLEVVGDHLRVLATDLPKAGEAYRVLAPLLGDLAFRGNNISNEVREKLLVLLNQRG